MVKKKKENKPINVLLDEMQSPAIFVRKSAMVDLAQKGAQEAVPDLIKSLEDKEATIRGCAAWALGELEDVRAVSPLAGLLKDMDVEVRRASVQSLAKMGNLSALAALHDARMDSDRWVGEWALRAVERIEKKVPKPVKVKKVDKTGPFELTN